MLTAISGFGVAILHGALTLPEITDYISANHISANDADFYQGPAIMETCCVFFSTIYFAGQFLAKHIGDFDSAQQLHDQSRSHMRLLHILSGLFIFARQMFFRPPGFSLWHNTPSVILGGLFVTLAFRSRNMPTFTSIFNPDAKG